jgi:hypothetical protein
MTVRSAAAGLVAMATLAFVIALVVRPNDRAPALDAFLLLLGGVGLALLVDATSRSFPPLERSDLERALQRRPKRPRRVAELERLERSVDMSRLSAFDTYYRLRPPLREIADSRLAARGIELERPESGAEELLGEEAWSIVGTDVRRPSDHFAAGASLETVENAVTALERI